MWEVGCEVVRVLEGVCVTGCMKGCVRGCMKLRERVCESLCDRLCDRGCITVTKDLARPVQTNSTDVLHW